MEEIFLTGRVLVGGYYLFSALHHFANVGTLARYAGAAGVPIPQVAVVVSGLLLLVAGLSFILGLYPDIGIAALVLFLVPVTVMMHAFSRPRPDGPADGHHQFQQERRAAGIGPDVRGGAAPLAL